MKRLLTSCFCLGHLPIAPGTWGSLPAVIVFGLLCYSGLSDVFIVIVMTGLIVTAAFVCVRFGPVVIALTGKKDPREIVADEFAGQAVTFLVVSWAAKQHLWAVMLGGFLLFRVFDILKPWPIRKLEKLPKGWGILTDDLLAGLYAGIILRVLLEYYN